MDTNNKLSVHIIFTGVHSLAALITLIPLAAVSKASLLGYKSLCSFSPISTLILLGLAGLHLYLPRNAAAAKAA